MFDLQFTVQSEGEITIVLVNNVEIIVWSRTELSLPVLGVSLVSRAL